MGKRLADWTRQDFVDLHKIVKFRGRDPKTGARKWKGVYKAARDFDVSVPTIYSALDLHPTSPTAKAKKVQPKLVLKFFESEGWKKVKGHKYENDIKPILLKAWKVLGHFDPITWTPEMIAKLRQQFIDGKPNPLYIGITNDIAPENARDLRRAIKAMAKRPEPRMQSDLKDELIDELKDVPKRPAGSRLWMYMENDELIRYIQAVLRLEVLIYSRLALECGGRPISLAGNYKDRNLMLTTDKINEKKHSIARYESKKGVWAYPKFSDSTIEMVKRYVQHMKLPYGAKLLPRNQTYYSAKVKEAGLRAGVKKFEKKDVAAYIFRHTFATQAHEHDVSLEVIMFMGGWKNAETLQQYYISVKESKVEREIRGAKKKEALSFDEWVGQFEPYWEAAYQDCVKRKTEPKKARRKKVKVKKERKKVPFSWAKIEAITKSKPKTDKGKRLIAYWVKVWELHEKHPKLTFAQIKERYLKK